MENKEQPVAAAAPEAVAAPAVQAAAVEAPALGTNNLVVLIDALLDTGAAVKAVLADKKVGLDDLAVLVALMPKVGPAVSAAEEALKELKDLTAEEAAPLVSHVMAKLAVEDVKARAIVEASLSMGVAALKLIKALAA